MLLLELDRGIDLLALGANPKEKGPTERRALAYWLIVQVIQNLLNGSYIPPGDGGAVGGAFPPPASPIGAFLLAHPPFVAELANIFATYTAAKTGIPGLQRALTQYGDLKATKVPVLPERLDFAYLNAVAEELRVQGSLEKRWQVLVRTVAPEAGDRESVFRLLKLVIDQAVYDAYHLPFTVGGIQPPPREPTALPPQYEQSLATIASVF